MTTIVEPSVIKDGACMNAVMTAAELRVGMIVTNLGVIDAIAREGAIARDGVFVIAAIRGTVWSVASGKGDIATLDVTWHESQQVSVDQL